MAWCLTLNGRPVASHDARLACVIEAFERGWVWRTGVWDFPWDERPPGLMLGPGVRIARTAPETGASEGPGTTP